MSKIVILAGSPRKDGNTEKLVDAFVKGAETSGHQITRFSVIDTQVHGCLACDYCMRNEGRCIQRDGMQAILDALYQADTVVFASPVYYFGLSAQLKAIIDRFYPSAVKPFPIKSAALLLPLGGDPKTDAAASIANYKSILDYMQWQDHGTIVAGHVMDKGDIDGTPALQEAENLGLRM